MQPWTHRVLIPVVSWILWAMSQLLKCIEAPEVEETSARTHHPCDVPGDWIPPVFADPAAIDWQQLLAEADARGETIQPLRHRRKPLDPAVATCPRCGAPREYLESFGHDQAGHQRLRCRVCRLAHVPGRARAQQGYPRCPFCGCALELFKRRTEFTVYRCPRRDCHGRDILGKRYKWRDYHWEPAELRVAQPAPVSRDLGRVRYSGQVVAFAVHSVVGLGLSLRQAGQNLRAVWQLHLSPETLRQWLLAVAHQLSPLLNRVPLPLSGKVAVDETYIRVRGRWHYLFTALDAERGHILALHLSPRRSAFAATVILRAVSRRYGARPWTLVTDGAPIYPIAVQYLRARHLTSLTRHEVVFGLEAQSGEPHGARRAKNRIERLFGTYKSHYERHKSFQTFDGAVAHAVLYMAFYNHLKPHDGHHGAPPVPLQTRSGQPINDWQTLFRYLAQL